MEIKVKVGWRGDDVAPYQSRCFKLLIWTLDTKQTFLEFEFGIFRVENEFRTTAPHDHLGYFKIKNEYLTCIKIRAVSKFAQVQGVRN